MDYAGFGDSMSFHGTIQSNNKFKMLYIPPLVGTNHRKGTIIFRLHCYVMKLLNHAFIWLCNMISGSCTLVLPSGSAKPTILILHEQQRSNSITAMNWQASRLSSICTSSDGAPRNPVMVPCALSHPVLRTKPDTHYM
jgi:hypothetical protein